VTQVLKRIHFRFIFIVSGFLVLIIVAAVLWLRMIGSPEERTGSDFISPYSAARVAQRWGMANVYNLELQQAVQAEVVGFDLVPGQVLMFNHPPYLVPLLMLLVNGDYVGSLIRYAVLMVVFYGLSLSVVTRLFQIHGWKRAEILLVMAGLLTFYPLIVSLVNTQDTAIMVFGAFLWSLGLLTEKDWLAGIGLALTTVRPHVTVLLTVPFFFRRQKVLAWFTLAIGLLGLASLLVLGWGGIRSYLDILLTAAGGEWYGMRETVMVNFIGLLWRLAPNLGGNFIHLSGWLVYGIASIGVSVMWAHSHKITEKQIGTAVILAVFAVPHLHYHDLTLLLVPLVMIMVLLEREGIWDARNAGLLPLILSLVLLLGSLVPAIIYDLPTVAMILMVLVTWFPQKIFQSRKTALEAQ
jgi:hypothetical protein